MNTGDLARRLVKRHGIKDEKLAYKIIQAIHKEIYQALKQGEDIQFRGFIGLKTYNGLARHFIDPLGRDMTVPATKRIKVLIGAKVKRAVGQPVREQRKQKLRVKAK
jgi:nucleoid DNA-binding protein